MRRKLEPYTNKQNIFINVEGNVKEALEDICYQERKTMTQKVQELIDAEILKKEVATANPIAITYHHNDGGNTEVIQCNKQRTIISFFAHCSDTQEAFHHLLDANIPAEEMPELDRRYRNFNEGWRQFKANVNNVITR